MNSFNGLNRLSGPLGASVAVAGSPYLYFGGTAYLGMPVNPDFLALYQNGLRKFGINNGTSRNNNVQLGIYEDFETYAADHYGAEGALVSSSGYLAAQLCIKHFSGFGKLIYAPTCHPALWLSGAPETSASFQAWAAALVGEINESNVQNWVLVSNSLNNLVPERYDFSFLEAIRPEKHMVLVIDDSHGIGVMNDGLGVYQEISGSFKLRFPNIEVVVVASMAKALGVDAGIILGREPVIAQLKTTNEFLGASPPAAAGLYAFMYGKMLYDHARNRLSDLQRYLLDRLQDVESWHFMSGFPVLLSSRTELADLLVEKKILISSFPYPDRNGPALNRIILCSWHTTNDLDTLTAVLNNL